MRKISLFLALFFICSTLAADLPSMTINRTPPTDCLYNMSKTVYGNPNLWRAIMDYNPSITDEKKIPNGMVIRIPDKSVAQQLMNATTPAQKQAIISGAQSGTSTPPPAAPAGATTPTPPPNVDPDSPPYDIERAFGSKELN